MVRDNGDHHWADSFELTSVENHFHSGWEWKRNSISTDRRSLWMLLNEQSVRRTLPKWSSNVCSSDECWVHVRLAWPAPDADSSHAVLTQKPPTRSANEVCERERKSVESTVDHLHGRRVWDSSVDESKWLGRGVWSVEDFDVHRRWERKRWSVECCWLFHDSSPDGSRNRRSPFDREYVAADSERHSMASIPCMDDRWGVVRIDYQMRVNKNIVPSIDCALKDEDSGLYSAGKACDMAVNSVLDRVSVSNLLISFSKVCLSRCISVRKINIDQWHSICGAFYYESTIIDRLFQATDPPTGTLQNRFAQSMTDERLPAKETLCFKQWSTHRFAVVKVCTSSMYRVELSFETHPMTSPKRPSTKHKTNTSVWINSCYSLLTGHKRGKDLG